MQSSLFSYDQILDCCCEMNQICQYIKAATWDFPLNVRFVVESGPCGKVKI